MTNICTKVTVRKRPIKNGQVSLYLDYYPAVRHPKTGKPTRREYLGIYIYADPKDKFETEFNKTMLRNAELSSAAEPKPSSTRNTAFSTATVARRASLNTSAQRWRTTTISGTGTQPTSTLKSIAAEAAPSMT